MKPAPPEDLLNTVIAADALRRRALNLPAGRFQPYHRFLVEPAFNLLGLAWGQVMVLLPWPVRRRLVGRLNGILAGHAPADDPTLARRKEQAAQCAREMHEKTGDWPAMLILTSHPATTGPSEWLRFEVIRQALVIADALVDAKVPGGLYRPHPQCVLAIDPFALDTVPPAAGGFYAAWMHRFYLAWDRQPSTQSWFQRHGLLRGTSYDRIAWRLLRVLRKERPVVMVLPGGLPFNARLLYGAREWVQRQRLRRWPEPKIAAARRMMAILSQPVGGKCPPEDGAWPEPTREAVERLLESWGFSAEEARTQAGRLQEEFRRAVPLRVRLFEVLLGRLVKKGKPLLLVAVAHAEKAPHVRVSEPWGVSRGADGALLWRKDGAESALPDSETLARAFVELFESPESQQPIADSR